MSPAMDIFLTTGKIFGGRISESFLALKKSMRNTRSSLIVTLQKLQKAKANKRCSMFYVVWRSIIEANLSE